MPIIDKFMEFFINCIRMFQFWIVVDEDEEAVILRNGRFHKHIEAGLHWLLPFYIDRSRVIKMTPDTYNLSPQGLTTKDGQTVTTSLIVEYCIRDAKKALLKVQDRDNVIRDSSLAACASLVQSNDWDVVRHADFAELLTESARKGAFRYGVEIMAVKFSDCTTTFSHTQTIIGS